ncbi:phage major capsid protein [Bacillus sp. SL00103]
MVEGRSLNVPDLPGGENFVPELERNPEGRKGAEGDKEERQKQFTKVFLKSLRGKYLTHEERELLENPEFRAMSGINQEDGGILIPEDISRTIKELKREQEHQLEQYVTVEPVGTRSGSRLLEKMETLYHFKESKKWEKFQKQIILSLLIYHTQSLIIQGCYLSQIHSLQDTDQAIMTHGEMVCQKSVATRNALILAILGWIEKG